LVTIAKLHQRVKRPLTRFGNYEYVFLLDGQIQREGNPEKIAVLPFCRKTFLVREAFRGEGNYCMRFTLSVRVSSDSPGAVRPVLQRLLPRASVRTEGGELVVKAETEGDDVKELNRSLLSALRRAEKRTRLRAEWASEDGTTYRFFDYVLKKTSKN
jgi:hypothetical protein